MAKVLIIGCGAIGYELGKHLTHIGHEVIGVKRHPVAQQQVIFPIVAADITQIDDLKIIATDIDFIFFIVSVGSRDQASYQTIYETGVDYVLAWQKAIGSNAPWFFVSSTSVYQQTQGEWIDEESPTESSFKNSQYILSAEEKIKAQNCQNVIIRFSGIYGPGREYLLRMAKQIPAIQQNPPYYTNRIHQRDCVGVLAFLLAQRLAGVSLQQCYLASDDCPVPLWDVMTWFAAQLGCALPLAKPGDLASDMNKRCLNHRLKNLGYQFLYPDYKTGYAELID